MTAAREREMSRPVLVTHDGECRLRLTLNRPDQANAVDDTLCDALLAALDDAARAGVRMVVLEGNGKNFCGGFDLSDADERSDGDLLLRFVRVEQVLQLLWTGPFMTVACAQGAIYGAGADLVASCTYRVGAPGCRFRFPGYRFGIALGTRRLGAVVGEQRARSILLANAVLGDAEAQADGLLTHLAEREVWARIVSDLSNGIADLSNAAMADLLANVRQDAEAADRDMANLVRSASRPGLRDRIAAYRTASQRKKS